jgi:pyrimidine operon attenuation protein/uracil phosphoribosyltransferase
MPTDIVSKKQILAPAVAARKLRRMAFQVAENNEGEAGLFIAGINGNGVVLAQNLLAELQKIVDIPLQLITIKLNKKAPLEATVSEAIDFNGKNIIVVDDVSNSGKTLLYALKPFLSFLPKKIQTLVLVERSHKLFSIQPDYVGLSVATTLQEHIAVEIEGNSITGAWLY